MNECVDIVRRSDGRAAVVQHGTTLLSVFVAVCIMKKMEAKQEKKDGRWWFLDAAQLIVEPGTFWPNVLARPPCATSICSYRHDIIL